MTKTSRPGSAFTDDLSLDELDQSEMRRLPV
jgi:hypothetical protein